jgi:hypothetical protein
VTVRDHGKPEGVRRRRAQQGRGTGKGKKPAAWDVIHGSDKNIPAKLILYFKIDFSSNRNHRERSLS